MNRSFPPSLAAIALVFAANPASAAERPKPKAPEKPPFEVAQPYPNSWYGRFGPTNCSWIDTGDGVFVIDTGATEADTKNLKAEIARTTKNKPVKWIAITHLHSDSNGGFLSLLSTTATVFVNATASQLLAEAITGDKQKVATVVGVVDRILLAAGSQRFEIGVAPGRAHSAYDLYVFDAGPSTLFTGDLVTTDRCPMLSDPDSDIKGWLAILERLDALGARGLVPTRENPTGNAAPELQKTRRYLTSMLAFLTEKKKQNAPEARVSAELSLEGLAGYCPRELNALNALSVYRRLLSDGTTRPGSAAAKPAPK